MVKIKENVMFWGVTLDGGKRYTQTVERSFHISMASLEPKMELSSSPSKNVRRPISVMVVHDKAEFILCTLEQGRCYQQALDLNFTEGEEVTLFLNGDGVVHLTGYLIDDSQFSDDEVFDEEEDIEEESEEEDEDEEESDEEIPQLTHVKDTKHKKRKDSKKRKVGKSVVEKLRFEEEEDEVSYDIPDYDDYDGEEQEDETESEEEVPKKFMKSDQLKDDDEDTNDSTLDTNEDAEQIQTFMSRKGKGKQLKNKSKSAQEKIKKGKSPLRETVQQFAVQEGESNELAGLSKKKKRKRKNKLQSSEIEEPRTSLDFSSEAKTIPIKKRLTPGGIKMEELKPGHGPQAVTGKTLHVYYTGRLAKNGDVFDSKTSGKPFTFRLGKGEVIKGWDVAFQGLRVGGKRRLGIPPSLGYGSMQAGPIPPNSTLLFDVELKAVS